MVAFTPSKPKIVLFWINGVAPTDKDISAAEKLTGFVNIQFRNANYVPDEGSLEPFDELAGDYIPKRYADELAARQSVVEPMAALTEEPIPAIPAGPDPVTGTNTPAASEAWGKPRGTV